MQWKPANICLTQLSLNYDYYSKSDEKLRKLPKKVIDPLNKHIVLGYVFIETDIFVSETVALLASRRPIARGGRRGGAK